MTRGMDMKTLMTSAATVALALSLTGTAGAQGSGALGESSLRPMEITCADLSGASEEERTGLVFFIAGYQAAMQQIGAGMDMTGATGGTTTGAAAGGDAGGATSTTGGGT